MKSETSQVAARLRKQNWITLIRDCQSRPKNMKLVTWCEQNGVTKDKYYYWMHKLRQECLDEYRCEEDRSDAIPAANAIVPVPASLMGYPEAPACQTVTVSDKEKDTFVDLSANGINIHVTDNTSSELLMKVLEVISRVK
jgi:hypothetical protein